jgi:hypothetical protein
MAKILYDRTGDPQVRASAQKLRRKVRPRFLVFAFNHAFPQVFVFAQFRTSASVIPIEYQLLLHLMLLGILILGVLIDLDRYRRGALPPRVTSEALIIPNKEEYALRSIREVQLSPTGDLTVLHFDRRLRKLPVRLMIGLRGSTIPDPDEFVSVLRKAWENARLTARDG